MSVQLVKPVKNEYVKMRWAEPYVSNGLNIKDFGVVRAGIYSGFVIGPNGLSGRGISIGPGFVSGLPGVGSGSVSGYSGGDYDAMVGYSIAVQEVHGASFTIQLPPGMDSVINFDATGVSAGRKFIVSRIVYGLNQITTMDIALVDGSDLDLNPTWLVIGYVDIPVNPLQPLDGSMFGYLDPLYPRLTPLATRRKAGFMPPSIFDTVSGFGWQSLLQMQVADFNANYITISPSQGRANGKRVFTFVKGFSASKFPRNAFNKYNGGVNDDQLTVLHPASGGISGAHQLPGNLNFAIPAVVGVPNKFQVGLVSINELDNISVVYGNIVNTYAETQDEDNFPVLPDNLFQIGAFIASTDGFGSLNIFAPEDVMWRRPYLNSSGSGFGIGNVIFNAETPAGAVDGVNQTYTVSIPIKDAKSIMIWADGLLEEDQYSASGTTITLVTPLQPAQTIYCWYIAEGPNPLSGFQEKPSGIVDGVNDTFNLAGKPPSNLGMFLLLDGQVVENNKWILIQDISGYSIKFKAGFVPKTGQTLYTFYIVNNSVAGNAPSSGGYVVQGSPITPVVVSAGVGVFVTGDGRQLKFIKAPPGGGAVLVTANPQIQPGSFVGQELCLMGADAADYPIFSDGNGLLLNGPISMDVNGAIELIWTGSAWWEKSRR